MIFHITKCPVAEQVDGAIGQTGEMQGTGCHDYSDRVDGVEDTSPEEGGGDIGACEGSGEVGIAAAAAIAARGNFVSRAGVARVYEESEGLNGRGEIVGMDEGEVGLDGGRNSIVCMDGSILLLNGRVLAMEKSLVDFRGCLFCSSRGGLL